MIDTFEDALKRAKKVVFLIGAGILQQSGISTLEEQTACGKNMIQ